MTGPIRGPLRSPEGYVGPLKGILGRGPLRGPIFRAHMDPKGDPYMGPKYSYFLGMYMTKKDDKGPSMGPMLPATHILLICPDTSF